jgi:hypothetical protein
MRKMIERNLEREKMIYGLWKQHHNIPQISERTGIPRSTVGYYIKRFKNGKIPQNVEVPYFITDSYVPVKDEKPKRTKEQRLIAQASLVSLNSIFADLMLKAKYREAKDLCDAMLSYDILYSKLCEETKGEEEITFLDAVQVLAPLLKQIEAFVKKYNMPPSSTPTSTSPST